jgi:hypothetical protein
MWRSSARRAGWRWHLSRAGSAGRQRPARVSAAGASDFACVINCVDA